MSSSRNSAWRASEPRKAFQANTWLTVQARSPRPRRPSGPTPAMIPAISASGTLAASQPDTRCHITPLEERCSAIRSRRSVRLSRLMTKTGIVWGMGLGLYPSVACSTNRPLITSPQTPRRLDAPCPMWDRPSRVLNPRRRRPEPDVAQLRYQSCTEHDAAGEQPTADGGARHSLGPPRRGQRLGVEQRGDRRGLFRAPKPPLRPPPACAARDRLRPQPCGSLAAHCRRTRGGWFHL